MTALSAILIAADVSAPCPAAPAKCAGEVLLAHEPQLRRLVHRLLAWPAPQDVEDVVQEVLLAAWRHRDGFRGDAAVSTWLFRIAVRTAQRHARRAAVRRRWFGRGAAAAADDALAAPALPCAAERADDVRAVREAMAALRHADREVLVLRYLEGRAIDEIAALLGIARAAADARLSRARARLRERLGAEEIA